MQHKRWLAPVVAALVAAVNMALAADPAPATPAPAAPAASEGWKTLFDGTGLDAWQCKAGGWTAEPDGVLAMQTGGGYIWTRERFGDFVLDLEFKLDKGTNSGVFIRTDKTGDPVQTGIEIQLLDSFGKAKAEKHDCGAVYDCLAPSANAVKAPGEWNHMVITAQGNRLQIVLNDQAVIDADLNQWTQAHKNPDGSGNKFNTAYKDMPKSGAIGFQDHGKPIWFRHIRIRPLA